MKKYIFNIDDLSSSREMLKAKEPLYILGMIIIIFIVFSLAFIWSYFSHIDQVIKAKGVVRPLPEISTVRNVQEGYVKNINFKNGDIVKKNEILYTINNDNLKSQKKILDKKLKVLKAKIELLKVLKSSIRDRENQFINYTFSGTDQEAKIKSNILDYYQNRFHNFLNKYEKLEIDFRTVRREYKNKRKIMNVVSRQEVQDIKNRLRTAELNLDEFRMDNIIELESEINKYEDDIFQINQELKNVREKLKLTWIRAPISGKIQVIEPFLKRSFLPAGLEMIKIIPDFGQGFKMEIEVDNKDISQIHPGQKVKYHITSFPHKEFGVATGEIMHIDEDIGKNNLSYKITASINQDTFYDKKDRPYKLKPGMSGQVKIIFGEKTVFNYLVEKLDLKW
ncbi:MAG: HlyD family efflux transporter periplasmic adaptor subunit [bacterium]